LPNSFFKASDNTQAILRPQQVVVFVAVEHCAKQMSKSKENILAQKEFLAAEALKVANESLGYIQDALPEASIRDLVSIFNSAVKTHRDIVSDIVSLTATESKSEAELAVEYGGKVDELLKSLGNS
jgi:hypothetical protein